MSGEEKRAMEKPYWEGKEYSYFSHKNCEYFPCHKGADPENFNCLFCYCPLYALGKTAPNASFLTEEKISDMLQVNIASLRKLYGSSGKNKKQASSDTGKCIFLCLNWPVLFGVDNICYLSEKIQKIILWFGEKP